jgi:hypothetical protein
MSTDEHAIDPGKPPFQLTMFMDDHGGYWNRVEPNGIPVAVAATGLLTAAAKTMEEAGKTCPHMDAWRIVVEGLVAAIEQHGAELHEDQADEDTPS